MSFRLELPCCIMMGSEDKGLQPYLNKAADRTFYHSHGRRFQFL